MANIESVLLTRTINSIDDCVEFFHLHTSPTSKQLIGIEHEFHMLDKLTGLPIAEVRPKDIHNCLKDLCSTYGYQPIYEDHVIIGADNDGIVFSLEPGGQIEISTRPESALSKLDIQLNSSIVDLVNILTGYNIKLISAGYCPTSTPDRITTIESKRYEVMMPLLQQIGQNTDAQKMTASIQVSTDYSSAEHAACSLIAGILLQPYIGALFANSPLANGALIDFCSYRMHIWNNFKNSRAGLCDFFLEDGFISDPFYRYAEWARNLPLLFIERNGQMIPVIDKTFKEYMHKGHGVHKATMSDWELHLGTLFPYARLKNVIEYRAVDSCSTCHALALAAFWKGIVYDIDILNRVISEYIVDDINFLTKLYDNASRHGLNACGLKGEPIGDVLIKLLNYSRQGLIKKKMGEEKYLDVLVDRIARMSPPYSIYDLNSFLSGQNSTRKAV